MIVSFCLSLLIYLFFHFINTRMTAMLPSIIFILFLFIFQCMKSVQDSVASKLSKRLLFETFPNIDKTALIEIYKTQGGSFQKTYDILQAFENETPKTVATSEFLEAQERALFEEARQESLKVRITIRP